MNVFVRYNFLTTKFKVVVFLFFFNSAPFGVGVEVVAMVWGWEWKVGEGAVGEVSVYQKRLVSVVCDGLRHS